MDIIGKNWNLFLIKIEFIFNDEDFLGILIIAVYILISEEVILLSIFTKVLGFVSYSFLDIKVMYL